VLKLALNRNPISPESRASLSTHPGLIVPGSWSVVSPAAVARFA
jgi:hypothetical protein